jgi:GT2 family glycosyltransferase
MPPRPEGSAADAVSVVICAYALERLPLLLEAIDSVRRQPGRSVDLVVVVDGNPELLAEVARHRPDVRVVANDGPRGLSGARNTGIAASRGERIAFLDDDARADAGWLAHLDAAFADPAVAVAGGRIEPDWVGARPPWFPEEFDWVLGCSYRGQVAEVASDEVVPVRNVIGASMMARRAVFEAVGGFRTDLGRIGTVPVGGEETELCIRAAARFGAGSVVYVPRSVVHHHVPEARATVGYVHRRCHAEGLSKAVLSRLTGPRDGLSSERRYLVRTLPRAVVRHAWRGLRGDVGGLRRAGVLLSGTWMTAIGWLTGTVTARRLHPR